MYYIRTVVTLGMTFGDVGSTVEAGKSISILVEDSFYNYGEASNRRQQEIGDDLGLAVVG